MATFTEMADLVRTAETVGHIGKIENVVGMTIECSGSSATIGEIHMISADNGKHEVMAEVVGFKEDRIVLMPYENMHGIAAGDYVRNTGQRLRIPVGDFLQGRVIDALGRPLDGKEGFEVHERYTVDAAKINPLERPPIRERLDFGVKAIDGTLNIGKGQRIGIFSGSGVGKSVLMGMVARNVTADINVIALVGERGREVREFLEEDLGPEGIRRSVLIAATSDEPAMLRMKCPLVATVVAEYFRDRGMDVLLMMDSLTRFAMAQREIGLATGEPPVARGYTPSIYAELPKLLERSGNFQKGSITGVYTVLVEGDDTNEPISDTVRSILDGHIVLTRRLANLNHFPAVDVGQSISRLMNLIVSEEHLDIARRFRNMLGLYNENADLINIGAYKPGANPQLDVAVKKIDSINKFLIQGMDESYTYDETLSIMRQIVDN